jgi:hypothetical protein
MILSIRAKSYAALRNELDKKEKIIVLSCNNCAKKCNDLGGRIGLAALSDKLERDGFNVTRREIIGFACAVDLVAKRGKQKETAPWFNEADVIIPLACEDGEEAVKQVFPGKRVPKVNKTLGIGWSSPSVGVRLTHCVCGVDLKIDGPKGISLDEAAEALGLEAGSF